MTRNNIKRYGEALKIIRKTIAGIYPSSYEQRFVAHQKEIVKKITGDIFKENNAKTAQISGLNLAGNGYDFPS